MRESIGSTQHVLADQRLLPKRFLIVSNRLPYNVHREGDRVVFTRGVGGLVTALDPILRLTGGLWIGWTGSYDELPDTVEVGGAEDSPKRYGLGLVPLTRREVEGYYLGHSNKSLWPLFHFFQEHCEFHRQHWETYRAVNRKFADVILREYREGDLIWIHDYHLLLVPSMIREALPDARIGFFLHIPFPPEEIFLIEPRARELIEGILGADLVGFHTGSYVRNFIDAVGAATTNRFRRSGRSILVGDRAVTVGSYPISIASETFEEMAKSEEAERRVKELREYYNAEIIALGVDRLDYTKGILERLQAIELMLENYPEHQGKFTFIQISAPSRTKVDAYQEMRERIEQMVGRINGRFGGKGCIPIDYRYEGYSQEELVAHYRASDMALVTPLRDGMNLVAKEYVASRFDESGVLLLSRFAGAFHELGDAVIVNPYDPQSMAEAIHRAIVMSPDEKRRRMRRLRDVVHRNEIYWWLERYLRDVL
jgi:alpha,alpha-trehalose-phosphate synthase [UDP-forming]